MGVVPGHAAAHVPLPVSQQVLAGQAAGFSEHALHWPLTHSGVVPEHVLLSQHARQAPAQQMLPPPQLVPSGSVVHVPTVGPRLQAWQAPSQALSQQTSSTQWPEAHCPPWVQPSPFGWSPTHWPAPLQKEPATQSSSPEHVAAQALPSQRV
ncbi:MAG: hypothetical protein R2853_19000 [Thermomicrobiales bacterium]